MTVLQIYMLQIFMVVSGSNPNEITNVAYVTGYVQTNEIYSTGGTYNSNVLTINRNDGGLFNVTITGLTDTFVTAATLNSTTIELDRNEGLSTLNTCTIEWCIRKFI